mmetsp:Transcript_5986/g.14589  ORF Transcript_5986/g.14589 Transcript_5986/m.14589 type:complete len:262 (-) Transcript_5986:337-1122(-)
MRRATMRRFRSRRARRTRSSSTTRKASTSASCSPTGPCRTGRTACWKWRRSRPSSSTRTRGKWALCSKRGFLEIARRVTTQPFPRRHAPRRSAPSPPSLHAATSSCTRTASLPRSQSRSRRWRLARRRSCGPSCLSWTPNSSPRCLRTPAPCSSATGQYTPGFVGGGFLHPGVLCSCSIRSRPRGGSSQTTRASWTLWSSGWTTVRGGRRASLSSDGAGNCGRASATVGGGLARCLPSSRSLVLSGRSSSVSTCPCGRATT